jgi:hypothetical protein
MRRVYFIAPLLLAGAVISGLAVMAQSPVRRAAAAKPDLSGIWQAVNAAAWDVQGHSGELGVPAGQSVVEGGEIPYQPAALAQRDANFAAREEADPANKCYLPGVPRSTYMPFPFQIVQTAKYVGFAYEFAHASRIVYTDGTLHPEGDIDFWMGDSRGRWEGNTLVVDVKNLNEQTWFDKAGNFHSGALHVVERYTLKDRDHLLYEATLDDPKVFTRPWKISMPLYRRVEKNAQLLEYECVAYLEPKRLEPKRGTR